MARAALKIRGFLMHASHYDGAWCETKGAEKPFALDVALELVDAMAKARMNLLVVDCADGVKYKSHPELARRYTVPMSDLKKLAAAARKHGIDVVPKLNFSRSFWTRHDEWMLPYSARKGWFQRLDEYWKVAGDLIDELIAVCKPKRFFHIGMDEDHHRSVAQYVDHIKILRRIIRRHRLRPVMWNDSCHWQKRSALQVMADKVRAAEPLLPKDTVQVAWDYRRAHPAVVKRVAGEGFEVWGAPGRTVQAVRQWRRAVVAGGGTGLLLTHWIKCDTSNRDELLNLINTLGPECA